MKQQALEVFGIFKRTHGELGAKAIIEYIENKDTMAQFTEINSKLGHLATKEALSSTKAELEERISNVRVELKEEISNLRVEVKDTRTELIKWMFVFWIGQVLATCTFIMLFAKK